MAGETLEKIKVLLNLAGTVDKDDILNIYLEDATNFIYDYCRIAEIPTTLETVLIHMTIYQYRSKGIENLVAEDKGSLVEDYITEFPPNIMKRLDPYRRIRVI